MSSGFAKLLRKFSNRLINGISFFKKASQALSGYEATELVSVVIAKNQILRENLKRKEVQFTENDLRVFTYLSMIPDAEKLNVLDFGGGGGNLAAITEHFLPHKSLNWVIVETEAMAYEAQKKFQNENVSWISEIPKEKSAVGKFDLVIASSSIQYTVDPLETLNQIIQLQPRYIVINRTPLLLDAHSQQQYLQKSMLSSNGPGNLPQNFQNKGVSYPICIPREKEFEAVFFQNYRVVLKVSEGQVTLKGIPSPQNYFGYFLIKL